jgi:hypothetical protein
LSYATEANAIRTRFNIAWASTTPVAWPNKKFDPSKVNGDPKGADSPTQYPWVRFEILPSDAEQETMGTATTAHFLYDGMVTVQVFVPGNEGDGEARTLAEQACAIFRSVEAGGIIYDTPWITAPGNTDSGWYQLNVWAPYRREQNG